jgi:hypothetical protein
MASDFQEQIWEDIDCNLFVGLKSKDGSDARVNLRASKVAFDPVTARLLPEGISSECEKNQISA